MCVGSIRLDSLMYMRKSESNDYIFRHFNPSTEKIDNVELFCHQFTSKRLNLLGFVPRTYDKQPTLSVWAEAENFMFDNNPKDPTKMPDEIFLAYDYRNHNFLYENSNKISGEFVSYL